MTTVLVVDDSLVDRTLTGGLIQRQSDWTVVFAKDGREALDQIERHLPDVVLTDLQMPEMNGLELVKAVKADYPLLPVILMTARGSEQIAVQALQQGAAYYVSKSELASELVENISRVLTATGAGRTHARLMNRMKKVSYSFVMGNDPTLLLSLVTFLQDGLRQLKLFEEAERLRVGVALEEALLNAAYHGNLEVSSDLREEDHNSYYELARQRSQQEPYKSRSIFVDVALSPNEVRYVIRDEGRGFDPKKLPDPTEAVNLERASGRGLLLMRTFMDEISYNDTGNQVTMVKQCQLLAEEEQQEES